MTIFTVVYALGTIIAQIAYPFVAKLLNRNKIIILSFALIAIGYLLFSLVGYLPFLPKDIVVISLIGMLIFSDRFVYITTLIMLTNTIEYGEYMSGERNESILFSLRPFMAKMSSATTRIVALILIISGLYGLAQQIVDFEELKL